MYGAIGNNYFYNMGNPYMTCPTMSGQSDAFARGNAARVVDETEQIKSSFANAKAAIAQSAKSGNLSEEQISALQEELERITKKEEEILSSITPSTIGASLGSVRLQAKDYLQQIVAAINSMLTQNTTEEQGPANQDGNNGPTDSTDETLQEGNEEAVRVGDAAVDPNTGRPAALGEAITALEASNIVLAIKKAVDKWGTDHETLDPIIENLDETNIVEVVKAWEGKMGTHTEDGNDGFFARIFDDVGDDWQNKYVPHLLEALVNRAKAVGIPETELEQYIAGVHEGMTGEALWGMMEWHDDHKIANNLMAIYDKIVKKEEELKKTAQSQVTTDNTTNNDDINARKEEVTAQKKQEFQNALRKAFDMGSGLPELTAGFKVITDDNGEFKEYEVTITGYTPFRGKTFEKIVEQMEEYDIDPKTALTKQKVDINS